VAFFRKSVMTLRSFTPKGLNINNPGLSDKGALPRVMEYSAQTVRGEMPENAV